MLTDELDERAGMPRSTTAWPPTSSGICDSNPAAKASSQAAEHDPDVQQHEAEVVGSLYPSVHGPGQVQVGSGVVTGHDVLVHVVPRLHVVVVVLRCVPAGSMPVGACWFRPTRQRNVADESQRAAQT